VIPRPGGLIVSDNAAVAAPDALSVTFTVKFAVPAAVGVPEIVPPALRFIPAGSDPLATDQVYGGAPPLAASACEYAVPTVPTGSDDVVIPKPGGLIVNDSAAVAVAEGLSVTFTVKLAVPAAVGVPEIVPPALRFRPAGSDPPASDQEYGGDPPVAVSGCE
jgi:hypothetical protein